MGVRERIDQVLQEEGYTPEQFLQLFAGERSKMLVLSSEAQQQYNDLYDKLAQKEYTTKTKGKLLEDLVATLFNEQIFRVIRDCRTTTNEIDFLLDWSENARAVGLNSMYPCFGDCILYECKNYSRAASVTYIGKFASLLLSSNANIGIFISWEGVTGKGWRDGCGLIKKLALAGKCEIIVLDKSDLGDIRNKEETIFNIIHQKYIAQKNDVDYQKLLKPHEAQEKWNLL